MRQKLRADGPLYQLALGYDKLETGSRAGNRWQDFEFFVAAFRAVKASAFRGKGWIPFADLHYGAKLSAAARVLHVRTPSGLRVLVATANHQYPSKSSMGVKAVRAAGRRVSITSGNVVVLNGVSAKAADVFLNSETTTGPGVFAPRRLREAYACRHRISPVNQDDFNEEWHKAADPVDLFIFYTPQDVNVDLDASAVSRGLLRLNYERLALDFCFNSYADACRCRWFLGLPCLPRWLRRLLALQGLLRLLWSSIFLIASITLAANPGASTPATYQR